MLYELIKSSKILYPIAVKVDRIYRKTFERNRVFLWVKEHLFTNPSRRIGYFLRSIDIVESRKYRRLKRFKGIHKGERCFIVCTGPSLRLEDLEKLNGEICFSKNSIVRLFDKTSWRPAYITINDDREIKPQIEEAANKGDLKVIFYDKSGKRNRYAINEAILFCFPIVNSTSYARKAYLCTEYTEINDWLYKFSSDLYRGVSGGGTSTNIILQIAVYMGFKEIYLLGCDNDFCGHLEGLDYGNQFNLSDEWKAFETKRTVFGFMKAKEYADKHGIMIYNATRGGELEVFERVDLDKVLNNS